MTEDRRLARGRRLFEYHCWESEDSADAELWHRTHQRVEVLNISERGGASSQKVRAYNGVPRCYQIRFSDGFEATAFEDELVASTNDYYCDDYEG